MLKKLISIILICSMILPMAACAKKDAAYVTNLIASIGEVTLESGNTIQNAMDAYETLSDEEKTKVEGYLTLYVANQKLNTLKIKDEAEKLVNLGKVDEAISLIEKKAVGDSPLIKEYYMSLLGDSDYPNNSEKENNDTSDYPNNIEKKDNDTSDYPNNLEKKDNDTEEGVDEAKEKAERIAKSFGSEYTKLISSDYQRIGLPEYARTGVTYKELAKMYLGDENFSYIVNPITDEDHYHNIEYVMLTGNFEYIVGDAYELKLRDDCTWDATFEALSNSHAAYCNQECALMCYFSNCTNHEVFVCLNDKYYYAMNDIPRSCFVDVERIHSEIIDVYLFVKDKYTEFRKDGKITSSSTEYEIAKAYSDWMCTLDIITPYPDEPTEADRGRDLYVVSAYSCLFNHASQCGGRAAAYMAFMKMEGITTHGLINGGSIDDRNGHIVPWLLLDGKEYIFEYNMRLGLLPVDRANETTATSKRFHYFQSYRYNYTLKIEGLEYSHEYDDKPYTDINGIAITRQEWEIVGE